MSSIGIHKSLDFWVWHLLTLNKNPLLSQSILASMTTFKRCEIKVVKNYACFFFWYIAHKFLQKSVTRRFLIATFISLTEDSRGQSLWKLRGGGGEERERFEPRHNKLAAIPRLEKTTATLTIYNNFAIYLYWLKLTAYLSLCVNGALLLQPLRLYTRGQRCICGCVLSNFYRSTFAAQNRALFSRS